MALRISTSMMYNTGTAQMNTLQAALNKTQLQLSTNRKNLTPADDPIASSRALEVTQSQSMNTQLATNRDNAQNFLSQEELALASTTQLIQDVQELVVKAGNGSLTDSDRESYAIELEGRMKDLLAIANTSDGVGGYLFSGFKSSTMPFTPTATGATYQGDQGQPQLKVGSARSVPVADNGFTVFENNLTGNGKFTTAADPGNLTRGGGGIISEGSVSDPSLLTGDAYEINFTVTVDPDTKISTTTYLVTNTTLGVTVPDPSDPIPYKTGQSILVDGQQFEITGKPADLDKFTIAPSTKESLFTTLSTLLGVIRQPGVGEAQQASLTNGLNAIHNTLDAAYDKVLSVRADVGARLKELDYLDSSGEDTNLQYATTLSGLQDLDQVAAISLFTQQQVTLQAAQKSFTAISGLSLFNYIS